MRFLLHFVAISFLLALIACSAPSSTALPTVSPSSTVRNVATPPALPTSVFVEATPAAALHLKGQFVFGAGDGSLLLQDASGGEPQPLVERSTESIAQMPAFTLDGKHIVYSAMLFMPDGNLRADLRRINLEGTARETPLRAQQNDEVYFYPRPAPDGRWLVTHITKLQLNGQSSQLEWADFETGVQTLGVENASDGDVSADGKRIAFVRTDITTLRTGLWIANADGSGQQELVNDQTFVSIMNPRFSPDGEWLAFTVHGAAQEPLPTVAGQSDCAVTLLVFCLVQTAYAHSAPGSLWRVQLETGKFQQLTDIYDDSPISAWSHDNRQIAIHDFTGIRLIDLPDQKIYPLFLESGGMGGFDWFQGE